MIFYRKPFGWEGPAFIRGWSLWVNWAYYELDANIDFYDSTFELYAAGLLLVF